MKKIGGNTTGIFQIKSTTKNIIGEAETSWMTVKSLTGFLDFMSGQAGTTNNAKIQDSTHIFLCDYDELYNINTDNSRMIINGKMYEVTLIDNPMGMNEHLEIYLKYFGGGLGVR